MPELITSTLVGWGVSASAATVIANLGVSVVLSAVSTALTRPSGSDLSRELAMPKSLPIYRYVYGRSVRIQGSGAPYWVVRDNVLYGCILLNSRPSGGGNFALYLDRRAVGLSGDPRDFGAMTSGSGTVLAGNTFVTITHGLGGTPAAAGIAGWGADGPLTISNITSTTFRINLAAAAPGGGTPVNWRAVLSNDGGIALNAPFAGYCNVWLGLGDQTHPPARILQEVGDLRSINPEKFWPTDRWTNRTVLWVRFVAGPSGSRAERWPSTPPLVEVEADWSRVWDPRDEAQDADDPATWSVSDNQALCLLDALRQNPIARYPLSQIRLQDFIDAADAADDFVPLLAGGSERRYRVGGIVAFGAATELSDTLRPLEIAGAGSLFRAGGMIGYDPGVWAAPEITLTECLGDTSVIFGRTRKGRDLPGAIKGVYPDPAAGWEQAETPPRQVAADWDGGDDRIRGIDLDLVFRGTQAQRIIKIMAERLKLPRSLSATFPPSAIKAMAGARATVALPRETDARNGIYRITRSHPAKCLDTDKGVEMALPLEMEEDAAAVYAWVAATDEQPLFDQTTVPPDLDVTASWDSAALSGGDIDMVVDTPFELISSDPFNIYAPFVDGVEMRFRRNQETFWLPGAPLVWSDTLAHWTGSIPSVINPSSYDIAVRTVIDDRVSPWLILYAVPVGVTLAAPSGVALTPGAGQIAVAATAPADADCHAVQIRVGTTSDPEGAWAVAEILCDPSDPVSATATGLPAGLLHYVFVRAVTSIGAVGPWAATATSTPT